MFVESTPPFCIFKHCRNACVTLFVATSAASVEARLPPDEVIMSIEVPLACKYKITLLGHVLMFKVPLLLVFSSIVVMHV